MNVEKIIVTKMANSAHVIYGTKKKCVWASRTYVHVCVYVQTDGGGSVV